MYTIGSFSKLSGVSPKTLRFYDEIGLMKPAEVDDANRYRYYAFGQLDEVRRIHELKGYGLSLQDISRLLDGGDTEEIMLAMERRLVELKREKEYLAQTILNMERRLMLMKVESNEMLKQFVQHAATKKFSAKIAEISHRLQSSGKPLTKDILLGDPIFQEIRAEAQQELVVYAIVQLERGIEKPETEYLLAYIVSVLLFDEPVNEATGQEWHHRFCRREDSVSWLCLGIACRVLGLFDESEALLRKCLENGDETAETRAQLGFTLAKNNKFEAAEEALKQAIERDPERPFYRYVLGVCYNLSGDFIQAAETFTALIAHKLHHLALYERGLSRFRMKQYREAVQDYEACVALCADFHLGYYNMGIALWYLGLYAEAVEQYDRALVLDPDYGLSHYNRGVALMCLEQWEAAIPCFETAIRLHAEVAFAYYEWALACARLGNREEAQLKLDEAIKLDPGLEGKAFGEALFAR